jgi:hypothetical protein
MRKLVQSTIQVRRILSHDWLASVVDSADRQVATQGGGSQVGTGHASWAIKAVRREFFPGLGRSAQKGPEGCMQVVLPSSACF